MHDILNGYVKMLTHHIKKWHLYVIFFFLLTIACSPEEKCDLLTTSNVNINFYHFETNENFETEVVDSLVNIASAYGYGREDSLIYQDVERIRTLTLPLSHLTDTTAFILQLEDQQEDIIIFYYERQLEMVSIACGFTHYFTINKIEYTNHGFDSLAINNPFVTPDYNIHVEIFFY